MSNWTGGQCRTCRGSGEERRETEQSWPDGWRLVAVRECRECDGIGQSTWCGLCGRVECQCGGPR